MEATLVQNNLVARKAVDFRVHSLPAAPPALAALFPEVAIGAPLSRCGAQMLYGAQVRSSGAACLLLIVEAASFRDERHRLHFLAGLPRVQAIQHPHLLRLLWMGERGGNVCRGYEAFAAGLPQGCSLTSQRALMSGRILPYAGGRPRPGPAGVPGCPPTGSRPPRTLMRCLRPSPLKVMHLSNSRLRALRPGRF